MFTQKFKSISPEEIEDNMIRLIGKDWMLITAGTQTQFNTMTASWGTMGFLWNKPVAVCFIRPQRFTFGFAEQNDHFTLNFLSKEYRDILNYCGSHSGRDHDKISKTGLTPLMTPKGNIAFDQSRLVLETHKLYADYLKEENFLVKDLIKKNYFQKDFHKFYIGEIAGCYLRNES